MEEKATYLKPLRFPINIFLLKANNRISVGEVACVPITREIMEDG
jgi:hypothetical protein